jgi:hypothetical protein
MKDPEEKEMMAYIAGLIDGDGNIGIRVGPRGKLCPLVQLHNSVKDMPLYLNKLFGGTLAFDKPKKEGNRIIWKWMLQGYVGCDEFLSKLLSYLVIKKDSALEVLEFINSPIDGKDYYQSCKDLNLKRKINDVNFENIERNNSTDPEFWAYLAGIMDTDGSFSIQRQTRLPQEGNRQKNSLIKFSPQIQISMVTEGSIKYILSNCQYGRFSIVVAKTSLRGKAFRFSVSVRFQVIEFLKKIIPFLHIKSKQAMLLLKFCRNYIPANKLAFVPEDEKQYREDCYKQMIMLNNTPS